MRDKPGTVLLELANRQFGVLRLGDLAGSGLDRSAISRWVAEGRLTRLHCGVYCLGHSALRPEGRWLAAVWACGDHAVLSHTSAAAFYGYYPDDADAPVHVTTTRRADSRPGIVVHR